jgi:hypothetical protein
MQRPVPEGHEIPVHERHGLTCWRYAAASDRLSETDGRLDAEGAMGLLAAVSEQRTVWSSSYDLTRTKLELALGRKFTETLCWSLGDGE